MAYFKLCMGNCSGPLDCYFTMRGLKTLKVRGNKQVDNAKAIGEYLSNHAMVAKLYAPGKYDNVKDAKNLEKYCKSSGAMMSFMLKTGSPKKFVNALKLFSHTEAVNGVDSSVLLAGKWYSAKLGKHDKILSKRGMT